MKSSMSSTTTRATASLVSSSMNMNNMVNGTIHMRMMPLSTSSSSSSSCSSCALSIPRIRIATRPRSISCEVAFKSSDSQTAGGGVRVSDVSSTSQSQSQSQSQGEVVDNAKIGARVRVKVPLKVYHVPKVPELDLSGMEGQIKLYVGLWNGKRISANLPYKVEFVTEIQGRGPLKFFAHLKEDEFEYI